MTKSAGTVQNGLVLRLSVPSVGDLTGIGLEMGARLAQQLGLEGAGAARVSEAMAALAGEVGADGGDIAFEFHKVETELKIEARQGGRSAETRVPLPA
ncbi:MAG TPA: hypothetical protein VM364_13975 [Vicinamibacterales bacterium]|nr:hypothetical protein [Vicinamibacterales bacterium]